jgi:hypothetical protein
LLTAVPSTTVTRITAVTPPLTPLPAIADEDDDGSGDGKATDRPGTARSSRLAIGWSVIQ